MNLQMQGMKGENVIDDTCWIVKTHSPLQEPANPVFSANKVVVVVRNPLDTIFSWLNLVSLMNHVQKAPFDYEKSYPKFFAWWVKHCGAVINAWYVQTMLDAKARDVPMLFVRYEDLMLNPEPELRNIMKFLLDLPDLTGTNAERRV